MAETALKQVERLLRRVEFIWLLMSMDWEALVVRNRQRLAKPWTSEWVKNVGSGGASIDDRTYPLVFFRAGSSWLALKNDFLFRNLASRALGLEVTEL